MCNDICPDKALIWCDFKAQTSKDGIQIIKNYGNIPKYYLIPFPTATASNYTLTSGSSTTTNPSEDILRVTLTVGTGVAYKGINNLLANNWYEITGECRSDGFLIPALGRNGNFVNVGTTSTAWKSFRYVYKTSQSSLYFGSQNATLQTGPKYTEWRNISVNSYQSSNCVISGDGNTSTTYPTQLSGQKGVYFDGGDYIDTGIADPFAINNAFTLTCVVSNLSTSSLQTFFSTYNTSVDTGISFYWENTTQKLRLFLYTNASNAIRYYTDLSAIKLKNNNIITATYNGGNTAVSANIFINGVSQTITSTQIGTVVSIASSKTMLLGASQSNTIPTLYLNGNMHHASVFPYALSSMAVKQLHNELQKRLNLF